MNPSGSQTCLVLGATGGIGQALCELLHRRGARLVLCARGEKQLNELAAQYSAEAIPADITQAGAVDQVVSQTMDKFGRLDALAHCVGSIFLKPVHLTSDEEWEQTLRLNLYSAFYALRAGVKAMMKTGGSIALCSTAASLTGVPNHEAIAAAKGGINSLVLSAAATYASYGIRVNAVAPGLVRTPLSEKIISNERSLKVSLAMHPLGRIGEPSDIAASLDYFLDPSNSWITGQIVAVDGGLSTLRPRIHP